jgi:hypothetical protein
MQAEELLQFFMESGADAAEVIDEVIGRSQRSYRRPRQRRFSSRGAAVDPITGRRKDPRKRRLMRMVARKNRSKYKRAAKKRARKLRSRGFYKKLGKLSARLRK